MECKRCGNKLTGKQTSYCGQRCSRLHLKSLWRKRNKEKVNKYNRKYREKHKGGFKYKYLLEADDCYFCKAKENLQKHHLNYRKHYVVVLCSECHHKHHFLLRKTTE